MSILDILEDHKRIDAYEGPATCSCEEWESRRTGLNSSAQHRQHLAQVLEEHEREAKAEAWDQGAEDEASAACMNPPCGACDGCFTPVENPYKED